MTEGINGAVLINKPEGVTSFQSLGALKRALGTKKVGHTGTLDKFAHGLLVVLTGKLTKLNSLITGMDKEYVAVIKFGEETSTLDPEGEVISTGPIPDLTAINHILPRFLGSQDQVPPVYSAVHVNGTRAYQLARDGVEVEMKSRPITIHHLELLEWNPPFLSLKVSCSKGTYIRSLARDIANACGSAGHLVGLQRTSVGSFTLEKAVTPDQFGPDCLVSPMELFSSYNLGIGILYCDSSVAEKISQGKTLTARDFDDSPKNPGDYGVFSRGGDKLVALIHFDGKNINYRFVV